MPKRAADANPYASPTAEAVASPKDDPRFDLTEAGARRAQAIVADAQSVFLVIFLAWCICGPAWLVMLPWYLYRLYGWHRLNAQFVELREPNSFSPYGQLAGQFRDAKARLWIGVAAGGLFWAGIAALMIARLVS